MSSVPFARRPHGLEVNLQDYERKLLLSLVIDLRHLLVNDEKEEMRRLKPPAHPEDKNAELDYRSLVDAELLRSRLNGVNVIEETINGDFLNDDQVAAWMHALNNIRLILGHRLVLAGANLEEQKLPEGTTAAIFEWTGGLLECLVSAAASSLPQI